MPLCQTKLLILLLFSVTSLSCEGIRRYGTVRHQLSEKRCPTHIQRALRQALLRCVDEAHQKALKRITLRASEFSAFIHSRKSGVKPFSKEMVSLSGKLNAAKSLLSTDKSQYAQYVEGEFSQYIFTLHDLEKALKRAVETSAQDIEKIEEELAATLRRAGRRRPLSPGDRLSAAEEFSKVVDHTASASQQHFTNFAENSVAKLIARNVGRRVLKRLGVPAKVLTFGMVNSWWSRGATLLISIAVDQIWEWIEDPAADIEREVIIALNELSQDVSKKIEEEMKKEVSERRQVWDRKATRISRGM